MGTLTLEQAIQAEPTTGEMLFDLIRIAAWALACALLDLTITQMMLHSSLVSDRRKKRN